MRRIFKAFMLTIAAFSTVFAALPTNHGTTTCCAECQMKKEDEVEVVQEEEQETEA